MYFYEYVICCRITIDLVFKTIVLGHYNVRACKTRSESRETTTSPPVRQKLLLTSALKVVLTHDTLQ